MSREDQIFELIEEILETNRTPEEVCAERGDLLDDVRARLRKFRDVAAQVDSLFPEAGGDFQTLIPPQASRGAALPEIPGYEIETVLGRGGMGIVYKARHLKLQREVALKMLLTGSYASRQEHSRFVREAESVAAFRHPNIVQIHEFGEVDGHPFYTMEYVGGGSLAERLAGTMQGARESALMASMLARAVQVAHDSGIVHRDLKPANILLSEDGTPKIADFGLARRFDQDSSLTRTGARIGTPSYMAPEQLAGDQSSLGPAVDVFALGALLYEMLTGRPPFRGDSLSDTERRLATEEPVAPSRLNPKVPRDLETICIKCLEKEPRNRYASAGDLAADMERFLRHEPIEARPIAPVERWIRWVRRNPLTAALIATSVVLVGLIASQVLQEWTQAAAERAEKARLTSRFESGVQLVQEGRFAEAGAILGKLGDGGFLDLRERIDRALSDLKLVDKLESVAAKRATALATQDAAWQPGAEAIHGYEALFADAGIGKIADDPAAVADRVRASNIKGPLVAALDDWAVCETNDTRRSWILSVARSAGVSDRNWENQCRDPKTWLDRAALAQLAENIPVDQPSVQLLRALGDRLAAAGLDATAFRVRVQQAHIDSFLANLSLADSLAATNPAEAVRYYQAALATQPNSATAHNNLAIALAKLDRPTEAIAEWRESFELDPKSTAVNFNLGRALTAANPLEAINYLGRAAEFGPQLVVAQRMLGELLIEQGRYADAESSLERCLTLVQDDSQRGEIELLLQQCATHLQEKSSK